MKDVISFVGLRGPDLRLELCLGCDGMDYNNGHIIDNQVTPPIVHTRDSC